MEILQRLQPLDVLFAIVWAAIVGWGLQTGALRQLGMLIGVFAAAVLAGWAERSLGQSVALPFGPSSPPILHFVAYVATFVAAFGLVFTLVRRASATRPRSRSGRNFGLDNVLGAALGAVWGVMLLIVLLTMLRFFVVVPWRGQETAQQNVLRQIQTSHAAPVLEEAAAPVWGVLAQWFPSGVRP